MWYLLRFFLKSMPDNDQAVLIEEREDPENITSYLYPDFVYPFTPFQMLEIDFWNPIYFFDHL